MNKLEKIKVEIERLKNELIQEAEKGCKSEFDEGRISAFEDIIVYINSLEEDRFERPNIKINDAIEVSSRMKYIDEDLKPIAEFILDYCSWNLHKDEWNHPTIEVPLFRVLDALMLRGKPYYEG